MNRKDFECALIMLKWYQHKNIPNTWIYNKPTLHEHELPYYVQIQKDNTVSVFRKTIDANLSIDEAYKIIIEKIMNQSNANDS